VGSFALLYPHADMPYDPMMLDSPTLHERSSKGDKPALKVLLDRHMDDLHAFVRLKIPRFLREQESVSDVVQSVCCEILGRPERFCYQGEGQFRNWLYGAVLHKIRDHERFFRRDKRDVRRRVSLEDSAQAGLLNTYSGLCSPSRQAVTRECLERIEKAFDELGEDQRELILLAKIVKLPQKEIAEQLGIKPSYVRVLLHRALSRLAVVIDRCERQQNQ
jgi:RNA polymerase sigma-70 factor, ECF subfamily